MSSEQLSICPKQTQFFILSFGDFGLIKHLLDRASPNIRFVVQIEADVGLSFASSNISLDLHNKSKVRLGAVQHVYNILVSERVATYVLAQTGIHFRLSTSFESFEKKRSQLGLYCRVRGAQ